MEQSQKDMIIFCLDFVKNNLGEQSQNVQCRNWLKTAIDTLESSNLSSAGFMIGNLKEVDGYFSGSNSSATSNTVLDKLEMVRSILKSE